MNINLKRKEIMQQYLSPEGIALISSLGGLGFLFMYISGLFNVEDLDMLYECIYNNSILIAASLLFLGIFVYYWISFFLNIIPPKKEVLYLNEIDNGIAVFLNKKGKKFYYRINQTNLTEKLYYRVLKTKDYIYEILEKTNENWLTKEKKSYWLNYYSPMGNFENIFLLPIVYIIFLPGFLSILMSKGYQKIYGIIYIIVPLYAILYDLIYKIKLKQSNYKEIDETNFIKSYKILKNAILIIIVGIICIFLLKFFLNFNI